MAYRSIELAMFFLLLLLVAVFWAACHSDREAKPVVVVSIEPERWLVQQLAADRLQVAVMVPSGASPESFDPAPSDMLLLSKASAYFSIGSLGFEKAWMPRFKEQNPTLPFFDLSEGLSDRMIANGVENDPHLWMTPKNMKQMAVTMTDALCRLFPQDSVVFKQRLSGVQTSLDELDLRICRLAAISPIHTFVIYHPALTYFARDYGLRQLAVENDHKEPSAASMQALVDEIKLSDARVLLMQQEYDARLVETLAQETELRVVRVNLLSDDWERELMRVVLEITR